MDEADRCTLVLRFEPFILAAEARGIADADLAVVPNCAHNVHLEKPKLFNTLLADFLRGT